jgi:hypothetical protein
VRAFARRSTPGVERDILLLSHVSIKSPKTIPIVADSTYLVDSLNFLITGDTGIRPGMRDLSKLRSHHRTLHSGRRKLGDVVDVGRCGTSER